MDFVILHSYTNYVEAHIAKGVLEESGIHTWLQDENTITLDPILTNAVGGIKLFVSVHDYDQAKTILNKLREEQKAKWICTNCGSHNIEKVSSPKKASNWLSVLAGFFLIDYGIAIDKTLHCFNCGNEFSEPKED